MTYEDREKIFSKEMISINDIQIAFDCGYQRAARIMRDIRRYSDRLHIRGKCHIQDYLDFIYGESFARSDPNIANITMQDRITSIRALMTPEENTVTFRQ